MDYFFMNKYIFKIIIKNNKNFIIKMLNSINININNYELFEPYEKITITDILLFTDNLVINIQLNKDKKSLIRNKIYIDCIQKLLPDYKTIQININLFESTNEIYNRTKIYHLFNTNEYIQFISYKDSLNFKTKNKEITKIIKYFKKQNINNLKEIIIKEEQQKQKIDELIKEN